MSKKGKKKAGEETADLIARFSEGYLSGRMTIAEGEYIIERLQDLADEALPLLAGCLESPDEDTRYAALALLRELDDSRAVPLLRRMLSSSDCSDDEKVAVIHTLDQLGAPIDEATFRRTISDPEALIRGAVTGLLDVIEDPAQVEVFLEMIEQGPPEMQAQYVQDLLGPLADRRLLLLLTALLHSQHDDVVLAAVDAVERLKEPATIPLLQERGQYDPSRRVRHAAENAALRLQTRVGEQALQSWITLSPLPLARCWLSTIDGSGGQVFFVARDQPDGELWLLDLMFNDHEGIKDCFSAVIEEEELDGMMDSFEPIDFVDVSLERARAEVARAYQTTLEAGRRLPPPLIVWRGWLEGEDARSIEEIPLPSLDPSRRAELLEESVELLELDEFEYWFFNPDEVATFVRRYRELLRKSQAKRGQAPFESLLSDAVEAVVDDEYRRLLPDRLRRQAWLLTQLYEDELVPLWALAAADALEDSVLVEHPLLRGMMAYSFLNAVGRY
jgi:hypothetical protein